MPFALVGRAAVDVAGVEVQGVAPRGIARRAEGRGESLVVGPADAILDFCGVVSGYETTVGTDLTAPALLMAESVLTLLNGVWASM